MTRRISRHIVSVLVLAPFMALGLISSGSAFAEETAESPRRDLEPEEWALEIAEKEYDRETGELWVRLENTSDSHSVTAFGILMVLGEPSAAEQIMHYSRDLIVEGGIPPWGSHELTALLGRPIEPGGPLALRVVMDHEILSDATDRGNDVFIEEIFESRTFEAIENGAALERLREARVKIADKEAVLDFLESEIERDRYDLPVVTSYRDNNRISKSELARIRAIEGVASQARQLKEHILKGKPADEMISFFEEVVRQEYETFSSNLRQSDLERLHAAEASR